jgi:glucose 1-dehydrogenase
MQTPDFNLKGRSALITGAARGIGLGIAHALAAYGSNVAIHDIDLDAARREAGALSKAHDVKAVALGGDIRGLALPERLVRDAASQLNGLHILINNASIQSEQDWTDVPAEQIETILRANFTFPVLLCQHAAKIFRAQKWGRIVNVGSIQQKTGNPTMIAYAASKSALDNLTRSLAKDLSGDGVMVNLIAPGLFHTLRNESYLGTGAGRERAGKNIPVRRVGEPRDAAGLALLLCSDAGSYITGQTIYVDGGLSIR